MTDPWRIDAEAYVLGALDEPERSAFEQHLRECADCRAAVEEVGSLPALLDLVPPDLVDRIADADPLTAAVPGPPVAPVPESVLAGALWAARRREVRRRRRLAGAGALAAAAAVVLALVLPASPVALTGHRDAGGQVVAMQAVEPSPVTASVAFEQVAWGTRIELTCTYADDAAAGASGGQPSGYQATATYALVVVGNDRSTQQVATWAAVPGRTITVPAATDLPVSAIDSIELVAADGTALLRASP
ncbi:MAG: zf-HC2 domain-containing protein [Actinomycetales bacterium]|nr:zf-HC2 domain-containing protein [Actinomycetales bacterium]